MIFDRLPVLTVHVPQPAGTEWVIMRSTILLGLLLFMVALMPAQSNPGQSAGANKASPKSSKGDIRVQGCVGRASGYYILMQPDVNNTYNLEEGNRKVKIGQHLGQQVEVTGWESPALSTSSSSSFRTAASSVTLMVTSIKTIAERCTSGDSTANPAVSSAPPAQLEISSDPADAEIEIDGRFVGHTTSVVSVESGEHRIVVKKSGYKSWSKEVGVTGGEIKVHAELERESK